MNVSTMSKILKIFNSCKTYEQLKIFLDWFEKISNNGTLTRDESDFIMVSIAEKLKNSKGYDYLEAN